MHITSICMHARSGHCAGQAVSYCIYVLERSRKVCKRAKLVGMDMVRVDNKLFTLAGTGKRCAQMNYITVRAPSTVNRIRRQRGWLLTTTDSLFLKRAMNVPYFPYL